MKVLLALLLLNPIQPCKEEPRQPDWGVVKPVMPACAPVPWREIPKKRY